MESNEKARRFRVVWGFVMFFLLFFERATVFGGHSYSIWSIAIVFRSGGYWLDKWVSVLPFLVSAVIMVLFLVRSILLITRKKVRILAFLDAPAFCIFALGAMLVQMMMLINAIMVIVDYMGARWLEERDAINAAYEKQKAIDKAEKEHKRRVRYFPGRYPEEFYRMIKKNDAYGQKGRMILVLGCFFTSACLYIMLTMYRLITQVKTKESFLNTDGLGHLFMQTGLIVCLLAILMMTMIISYYIKDRKNMNRLFVILGMRSRTVYLMFALLFGAAMLLGGVLGMLGGMAVSHIIRDIWQSGFLYTGVGVKLTLLPVISWRSVGAGAIAYLVVILLGLVFNQENIINLGRSMDMHEEVKREKRSRRYAPLVIAVGIVLYAVGILWYSVRSWAESLYIHIFSILGILSLLIGGITFYLNRLEQNEDKYYSKIMKTRPLYYRYWKSQGNIFYLSVIHFFVLAVFALQFCGTAVKQDVAKMYPYDIVCTAYDADMDALEKIAQRHDADTAVYPMLRMTSVYGSDKLQHWAGSRPIQFPQGQHIAISEHTYRKLKEAVGEVPENLNLKGNEMHVVYQQDLSVKAHTIDWDTARIDKRLRIGQPLSYYNPADIDDVFPVWQIKSEERDILTGEFHQGMGDNLIVFNDDYFEKAFHKLVSYNASHWDERKQSTDKKWRSYTLSHKANMTEGPTRLYCFNVPKKQYKGMIGDIKYLDEKYHYDREWDDAFHLFYGKQQMMLDTGTGILFRQLAYLFILLILTALGIFQYYVKLQSEVREINWQNLFLKKLGMREKERKRAVAAQMKIFVALPLFVGVTGGIIFAVLTAKARLYAPAEAARFGVACAVAYLVYIVIWAAWYFWMERWIWRQAQWER